MWLSCFFIPKRSPVQLLCKTWQFYLSSSAPLHSLSLLVRMVYDFRVSFQKMKVLQTDVYFSWASASAGPRPVWVVKSTSSSPGAFHCSWVRGLLASRLGWVSKSWRVWAPLSRVLSLLRVISVDKFLEEKRWAGKWTEVLGVTSALFITYTVYVIKHLRDGIHEIHVSRPGEWNIPGSALYQKKFG